MLQTITISSSPSEILRVWDGDITPVTTIPQHVKRRCGRVIKLKEFAGPLCMERLLLLYSLPSPRYANTVKRRTTDQIKRRREGLSEVG